MPSTWLGQNNYLSKDDECLPTQQVAVLEWGGLMQGLPKWESGPGTGCEENKQGCLLELDYIWSLSPTQDLLTQALESSIPQIHFSKHSLSDFCAH